jgi:hypothetical protein
MYFVPTLSAGLMLANLSEMGGQGFIVELGFRDRGVERQLKGVGEWTRGVVMKGRNGGGGGGGGRTTLKVLF